jgi:hypothetical protein
MLNAKTKILAGLAMVLALMLPLPGKGGSWSGRAMAGGSTASCGSPTFLPCLCSYGKNPWGQTCEQSITYILGIPLCGTKVGEDGSCVEHDNPDANHGGDGFDGGSGGGGNPDGGSGS